MLLVALVVSARCNDGARVRMIVEVAHLIYTPAWCVFNTPYVSVSRHSRSSRHSSARKPSKPGSHTRRGRPSTVRLRGMETGISEASKRVSIFSFATQGRAMLKGGLAIMTEK